MGQRRPQLLGTLVEREAVVNRRLRARLAGCYEQYLAVALSGQVECVLTDGAAGFGGGHRVKLVTGVDAVNTTDGHPAAAW